MGRQPEDDFCPVHSNLREICGCTEAPTKDPEPAKDPKGPRPTQATRLVTIADDLYTFGIADGLLFAYPKGNPDAVQRLDDIRSNLAAMYVAVHESVPNAGALADAMTVLVGRARSGEKRDDLALPEQPGRSSGGSVADELVRRAAKDYTLGVATSGEPFAVPNTGPYVARMLRGGRLSVRAELARRFFDDTGCAASSSALADAMLVLEGKCQQAEPLELPLRVAELADGRVVLDLGDDTGRVVVIGAGGWQLADRSPVLFRRTELTGPLPVPVAGGDLDVLWDLINVDKDDRPVLLAWLVSALLPGVPHPIPGLFGEQGCGKTTTGRVLVHLLDPGPVPVRKPPRDSEAWVTAASGSWLVCLDNLSDMPDWLSDTLCRAVTGDGDVRRQLYTDGQLVVFAFRRCIILTGIDLGAIRGDLADRLLPLDLHQIPETERREEAASAAKWQQQHPKLLGALLDLAVQVFATLPRVRLAARPRMADYARVLAAVDMVAGTTGLDRYRERAGALAADSLTGDPFVVEVAAVLGASREGTFTGTSAELLALATPRTETWKKPKDWPTNARKVTTLLKRQAPVMRRAGWTAEQLSVGRRGVVRWAITPPFDGTEKAGKSSLQPLQPRQETLTEASDAGVDGVEGLENGPSLSEESEQPAEEYLEQAEEPW